MLNVILGIIVGITLLSCISAGINPFWNRKDDTDGEKRSGLIVYTDYGTGVQYVANILGGMSVRVDAEGKPLTLEKDKTHER